MDLINKIFKISNIGMILFCGLNLGLITYIFTNGFSDYTYIWWIITGYIGGILISLSPIGEWAMVLLAGGRKMKRYDMKIRIVPLLEIVYNKAKKEAPKMVNSINLKFIYDSIPNAYAIGRRTICVTSGIFDLTDDEIMGVLAHELGHLANRHSEIQLIIGGSNLFISGILLALKIISWLVVAIFSLFAINTKSTIASIVIFLTGVCSAYLIGLWTKFCLLFMRLSMRQNEYVADKFAYKIGYGNQLINALDRTNIDIASENQFLRALNSTHPNYNERIARIQQYVLCNDVS